MSIEVDDILYSIKKLNIGTVITEVIPKGHTDVELVIPEVINGEEITGIAPEAFKTNKYDSASVFNKIVIQKNISHLLDRAFYNASVKEIVLNCNITEIPFACFAHSTVEKISFNTPFLTSIDCSAFLATKNLRSLTWPSGCTEIPAECFSLSGIEHIEGLENIEKICPGAFREANNLKKLTISSGAKHLTICAMAFGNSEMESIEIKGDSISIFVEAFAHSQLKHLKLIADNVLLHQNNIPKGAEIDARDCQKLLVYPNGNSLEEISIRTGFDTEITFP